MPEIKSHLQEITGDNLTYVLDTVDHGFHARSVYSLIDEMWESSYLVKGNIDEMVIVEKKAGYKVEMTFGSSQLHGDFTRSFWKKLSRWIEEKKIKPLAFKVVERGLSAERMNAVLDQYRDRKNPGKWHVRPNVCS